MPETVRAAIAGMGAAVPDRVLDNAHFEKFLDTTDEWITQRTGIKQRHVVSDGESTATLGIQAARDALADAKIEAADIDLIICATITPELTFPATACVIQHALGVTDVPCFDLSAACSGFIYGMVVAAQFIQTGTHKRVLLVASDTLSQVTDYTDRGSCILFGDAAGAVVLEAADREDTGLLYNVLRADGSGLDFIHVPAGGSRLPTSQQTVRDGLHYIKMRGREVYKFAVEKMQWLLGDCLDKCGMTSKDIDLVVPHQVNARIIQSATQKYDFPMEKVYVNIDRYGNTSGASIPLALTEARSEGRIGPGSTVLLVAFGAGLTWAGAVLKL